MSSKINVDGTILNEEDQEYLFKQMEHYIETLKEKATLDLRLKDILKVTEDKIKVDKKYVKTAATDQWKAEAGKLDLDKKNDEAAATEQITEIYEKKSGI